MTTVAEALQLAVRSHQTGDLRQAEQLYRQVLEADPQHADALYLLGLLAFQVGQSGLAIEYVGAALRLQPNRAEAHYTLGEALRQQGRLADAVGCYERTVRLLPDNAQAHNGLAIALAAQGKLEAAAASLHQVLRLQPDNVDAYSNLGSIFLDQGKPDEAIASLQQALRLRPDFADAHNNLGNALEEKGRPQEAVACYRRALALQPAMPAAHNNLGGALVALGRLDDATTCFRQALQLQANFPEALNNLGRALRDQGKVEEAVACFRQALALRPGYANAHNNLGLALREQGRLEEAVVHYRHAVRLQPTLAMAHNNLGIALRDQGRSEEAIACFRQALRVKPNLAAAHNNLANALRAQGQLHEAVACFRQALRFQPDFAEAHNNLGNVLKDQGLLDEAVACFRQALALRPDYPKAHNNLGITLRDQGWLDEAIVHYREALRAQPDSAETHTNLGNALKEQGRLDEAGVHLREACRLKPDDAGIHGNFLMHLNYVPDSTPATLLAEHRAWGDRHATGRMKDEGGRMRDEKGNGLDSSFILHPSSFRDRRLRIGYVSPDFRTHPVAAFLEPILAHHDPGQVEVFCYAEVPAPDGTTARLRARAHGWRPTYGLTDEQVAAQIRTDGIDLLVDLAGHTACNRLLVFAQKPAPVQLTYLGYPSTTGLAAIDYRLTDAVADPPDEPACHTEELWRLPGCFCCFAPLASAPAVASAPVSGRGHATFGSFHNLAKINHRVLDLWCRLLHAVPSARLLVSRHTLSGEARQRLHQELEVRGIGAERFELRHVPPRGSEDYLALYAEVDVLLDTFPWGGHTTACESLWMGVPVLTLAGDRHAGRMVSSVLHCLELPAWVARTPEEYIERGARLTGEVNMLVELRRSLRDRMRASPLCDGPAFTQRLEDAYRAMWRRWCAQGIED